MMDALVALTLSIAGGFIYSLLFVLSKELQFQGKKRSFDILITMARLTFLGSFLYILLKYWQTHSILIVISFIISFILTTVIRQKI